MSNDTRSRLLTETFDQPIARSLRDSPEVQPLPAQSRIVRDALDHARRCGLVLPRFTLTWVEAPGQQRGETMVDAGGNAHVVLRADVMPADLYETVLHETKHLVDFTTPGVRELPRAELEWRAVEFVARAMGRR